MVILLQSESYCVSSVNPVSSYDSEFIKDFIDKLLNDLLFLIDEPFELKIGEFHCGRVEYAWQVEIQPTDKASRASSTCEENLLVCVNSWQYYFARRHLKPIDNYSGRVEIAITMKAVSPNFSCDCRLTTIAKMILRLAYMHYYEGILKHSTDWETDYIDAPQYFDQSADETVK